MAKQLYYEVVESDGETSVCEDSMGMMEAIVDCLGDVDEMDESELSPLHVTVRLIAMEPEQFNNLVRGD
jgi:hypothetical protein